MPSLDKLHSHIYSGTVISVHGVHCFCRRSPLQRGLACLALVAAAGILASMILSCRSSPLQATSRAKVRVSYWGGEMVESLATLEKKYEALHPDVDIILDLQPGREYDMWMRVQILGRRPPPVMQAQWGELTQYIRNDRLLWADPLLDEVNPYTGEVWRSMYYQGRLNSVRDPRGRLFIIPLNQVKTAVFYNKNIFQECGIEPPRTFAELLEISETLKKKGYVPMGVGNVQMAELVAWNTSVFFDSVYRDEIPLVDVLHPDGNVDAEEIMRGYMKGIIDPEDEQYQEIWRIFKLWSTTWNPDFNGVHGDVVRRLFLDSKVVMLLTGCWMVQHLRLDINDLAPEKQFEFGVLPLPNVTEETSRYFHQPLGSIGSVGVGFVLPADADENQREAGIDWLRFLTIPESVEVLQKESSMLPCIHGVDLSPEMEGFFPLMDGTFPDLRYQEGYMFPDSEAADRWFRDFQLYLEGNMDLEELTRRWKPECLEGVERLIELEGFDPATW
jgi:ABC-type glycerol-3-phosphate transport system substrate-binding protein